MAAASAPPNPTVTIPAHKRVACGAKTRSRVGTCQRRAGHGTDHLGYGNCNLHGGLSPNGITSAAKAQALALGHEMQMEPHDAILLTVRRAAMWEAICASKVAELRDDELVVQHTRHRSWAGNGENGTGGGDETITETHADLNIWLREHQRALDQLARLAKTALDAGVQERQVRIAEQFVGDIASVIDFVLSRLGVRNHPDANEVVREGLRLIEGGTAQKAIAA